MKKVPHKPQNFRKITVLMSHSFLPTEAFVSMCDENLKN